MMLWLTIYACEKQKDLPHWPSPRFARFSFVGVRFASFPFPGWQPISIGKAKKFRKATAIAIAAAAAASSWSSNYESSIYVSAKYSYINCVCIYSLLPHTMYDSIEPRASSVLSVPLPLSYSPSLSLTLSLSLSLCIYVMSM